MTPTQIQELINTSLASAFASMSISDQYNPLNSLYVLHSSTTLLTSIIPSTWVLDSDASNHMIVVEHHLTNIKPYVGNEKIMTNNGHHLFISSIGSLEFTTPQHQSLNLANVYFVPDLSINLISISQLEP